MDPWGRRLAGIERRLVAEAPVLAEAFALWDARCVEASRPDAAQRPRWTVVVKGLAMGVSAVGAATMIPGWLHGLGWW